MNEELSPDDQEFVARARQVLDRTLDNVDSAAELRLQRARLSALDGRPTRMRWLWIGGAALASVAVLAVMLWISSPAPEPHAAVPLEDFELVTSVENVELAEDLDFYHWLADDDTQG